MKPDNAFQTQYSAYGKIYKVLKKNNNPYRVITYHISQPSKSHQTHDKKICSPTEF